jgi:5-(carboxyamino)imidazole ribonucleotide mutase
MSNEKVLVAVLMGSKSDADVMKGCTDTLSEMKIPHEVRVLSAHRTPQQTREYVESAAPRGIHVMIAGAGWAAHLAGVVAAHTTLPVIGVPIDSSPLQGMDSLLWPRSLSVKGERPMRRCWLRRFWRSNSPTSPKG